MKIDKLIDCVERHVVYFFAGMVILTTVGLLATGIFLFIIFPMIEYGSWYLPLFILMLVVMYKMGRSIFTNTEENDSKEPE